MGELLRIKPYLDSERCGFRLEFGPFPAMAILHRTRVHCVMCICRAERRASLRDPVVSGGGEGAVRVRRREPARFWPAAHRRNRGEYTFVLSDLRVSFGLLGLFCAQCLLARNIRRSLFVQRSSSSPKLIVVVTVPDDADANAHGDQLWRHSRQVLGQEQQPVSLLFHYKRPHLLHVHALQLLLVLSVNAHLLRCLLTWFDCAKFHTD
jgi:hypothetical protein